MAELLPRPQTVFAERYLVERVLGQGGMAIVYLAHDQKHHRPVAVKVLRPELASALGAARFLREIQIAAVLQHPHVVPLFDSGDCDGALFYVMPFVEGESLRHRLIRERQLPLEEALQIAREVAEALAYAHRHEIVHRDIKPENIMLSGGHALVADFGIARAVWAAAGEELTVAGITLGTPAYMSPEQAGGRTAVDARSDIYSLACVVYEMLGGEPPFGGPTVQAVLARHALDPVPPLRTLRNTVPEGLEQAVLKALAKTPADRFAGATEFVDALTVAAPRPSGAGAGRSIAVLPFVNLSGDRENEYFSDGMTEELINALTKIEALRVASRTSVFAFKGRDQDVRTIGRQLGVATVLEGSVRKAGNRLLITVQLGDVDTGFELWSDTYERELQDVFAIQHEIFRAIVDTLKVKLAGEQRTQLVAPHTDNIEAYNLYLKARYFWRRKSASGLRKCIDYFEQAITADPSYTLAHAGLADSYIALGHFNYLAPREAFPPAKAAARRALEIDDTLAEAHTALACVSLHYDWDWPAAERGFRRAIELNPRYPTAHFWYACYLWAMGRTHESVAATRRAHALAPLSLMNNVNVGLALYFARRYDEVIAHCRKALDLDPRFFLLYHVLGLACVEEALGDEAIGAFQQAVSFSGGLAYITAALGYAYGAVGKRAQAAEVLDDLRRRSKTEHVSSFCFAMVHTGLGDTDLAFATLERAVEERSHWLAYLKVWPLLDSLRPDPRFAALLEKVGLAS